jgi:hypothetical protein
MNKSVLFTAVAAVALTGLSSGLPAASFLQRLSAEFQNSDSLGPSGEIFTNAPALPAGAGGVVVYDKTLKLKNDIDVLYITFSGQADTHDGSALLMTAMVNGRLIEPLAGQDESGGGGPYVQTGWYTLSHLPAGVGVQNCNDGGGGTADCHDNTIYFSGCFNLGPNDDERARVQIKLASLPVGADGIAFYERATIYIDGQRQGDDDRLPLCKGVDTRPH